MTTTKQALVDEKVKRIERALRTGRNVIKRKRPQGFPPEWSDASAWLDFAELIPLLHDRVEEAGAEWSHVFESIEEVKTRTAEGTTITEYRRTFHTDISEKAVATLVDLADNPKVEALGNAVPKSWHAMLTLTALDEDTLRKMAKTGTVHSDLSRPEAASVVYAFEHWGTV